MIRYENAKALSHEIIDYLNTHPAFGSESDALFNWDFWNTGFYKITVEEISNNKLHPQFDFINTIFQWSENQRKTEYTKEDARNFLAWLDPIYCKIMKLKTSGFFEKELPEVPKGILKLPESL